MTTEAGDKGARSLGEVHNEVRKEIRNADLRQLRRSVNRDLIYPLLAVNSRTTLDPCRLPGIVFDSGEYEDLSMFAEAIPKLAAGMPVPVSWIQEKLNIPQPNGDELVFRAAPVAEGLPAVNGQASLSATDLKQTDDIDDMGAAVTPDAFKQAIDPLLKPVIASIIKNGPESAMQDAATLYPELDDAALIDLLTRAIFVADLWGRIDGTSS